MLCIPAYCYANRVERAFISEISPSELKGTMLGMHSTIVGVALLPASMIAGVLWNMFEQCLHFCLGLQCHLLRFACFFLIKKDIHKHAKES